MVWYYKGGLADVLEETQPRAAIVAYVHNERLVNLAVFDRDGSTSGLTCVPLVQEGDDAEGMSRLDFACWMPYQVGQAKKHEAQASGQA